MPGPAAARRPRPVAAHAGICVTRLRVGGSRSGECSKSGISPCDSARGVEAAEAEAGGGGGGAARRGRGGEGVHGGGAAASARAPGDRGAAAAAPATEGAPSGLAGGKQRRVGTGGGSRRACPPPSLPPSMGAGASGPLLQSVEGEPGAVTSELGWSSLRGRARQDRWPSTYQLAVCLVQDAFVLVQPRANLGRWRRGAGTGGRTRRASRGVGPAWPPPEGQGVIGLLWAIPGQIRCTGAARRGGARQRA